MLVFSLRPPRTQMVTRMADIQKVRFAEQLPPRPAKRGTPESQPVEVEEVSPVNRLDGQIERQGGIPFAGGTYYEVWEGLWKKGGGEVGGGKVEKVSVNLSTPILLT